MLQSILLQTEAVAESTIEAVENVIPHEEKLNILSLLFAPGTIWINIFINISRCNSVYIRGKIFKPQKLRMKTLIL